MNKEEFQKFLKRKGKKDSVIQRNTLTIKKFQSFLQNEQNKDLDEVKKEDIEVYVEMIEKNKQSPKGYLYVLMNYFNFIGNQELLQFTRGLREVRTKKSRRVFPLKGFLDINDDYLKELATIGITNVDQMLEAGRIKKQREELSIKLKIPEEAILELVKLSDLTRIGYIKTKLTRLYYNAGLDSPLKIAEFEPNELHRFFIKFIEESGWDGMIPNPKDLEGNITNARKLKKFVEE